jgi:hypothetical protein
VIIKGVILKCITQAMGREQPIQKEGRKGSKAVRQTEKRK